MSRNTYFPSLAPFAGPKLITTRGFFYSEPAYRREKFATLALCLMLSYATATDSQPPFPVSPESLVVWIGHEITKRVAVFEETEL